MRAAPLEHHAHVNTPDAPQTQHKNSGLGMELSAMAIDYEDREKKNAHSAASPAPSVTGSSSHSSAESCADASEFPMTSISQDMTVTTTKRTTRKKEPLSEAALEQRRRRNRESMQRARQRERCDVERMRVQLKDLEKQYRQAVEAHEVFLTQYMNPTLASYNSLAHESKALKEQNFRLQQELGVRRKAYERMERIVADYFIEKDETAESLDENDQELKLNAMSAPLTEIGPITEGQAWQYIQECCRDIEAFEKRSNAPGMQYVDDCFGWHIKHQTTNDSRMRFLFSKSFEHVYPDRTMDEAWELYGKLAQNGHKSLRVLRLEVLQQINADTQVVVRDIAHPLDMGVVLRTLMIRFRFKSERGLVGGRVSINPPTPPPDSHVRYADVTSWVEFRYLDPSRPDLPGCHVTFGGFADYRTKRELSSRFMTILSTVLTMEHSLFQPMAQLLPPSTDDGDEEAIAAAQLRQLQSADHSNATR